jgi:anti-sigma B factor antagonist
LSRSIVSVRLWEHDPTVWLQRFSIILETLPAKSMIDPPGLRYHWAKFATSEYNSPMPLSAHIEDLPEGIVVVTLSGGLTLGTSLKIADSQIQAAIEDGVTRMVIDLTDVEYVDSAGLGMLMYAYGMLNQKKGSLRLCGIAPRVMTLLQMTKTDTFLPIDKGRDESLAAVRG